MFIIPVLQAVERANSRSECKTIEDKKQVLSKMLKQDGIGYYEKLLNARGEKDVTEEHLEIRKKDHISHFILRLAYCKTKDMQQWFTNQEAEFFKMRFSSLSKDGLEEFLSLNDFPFPQVRRESCSLLHQKLNFQSN